MQSTAVLARTAGDGTSVADSSERKARIDRRMRTVGRRVPSGRRRCERAVRGPRARRARAKNKGDGQVRPGLEIMITAASTRAQRRARCGSAATVQARNGSSLLQTLRRAGAARCFARKFSAPTLWRLYAGFTIEGDWLYVRNTTMKFSILTFRVRKPVNVPFFRTPGPHCHARPASRLGSCKLA